MTVSPIDTDQDVTGIICRVVRLCAPVLQARVVVDHQLISDLSYHSLALAELGFTLEDLFGLDSITPEKAMRLHRVGDIVTLIEEALAQGDSVPATPADVRLLYLQRGIAWEPGA